MSSGNCRRFLIALDMRMLGSIVIVVITSKLHLEATKKKHRQRGNITIHTLIPDSVTVVYTPYFVVY